jgi:hypothetical protein
MPNKESGRRIWSGIEQDERSKAAAHELPISKCLYVRCYLALYEGAHVDNWAFNEGELKRR